MISEIMHKDHIAGWGLMKSKQKEGAAFSMHDKEYKILHICKNKDYRVVIEVNTQFK